MYSKEDYTSEIRSALVIFPELVVKNDIISGTIKSTEIRIEYDEIYALPKILFLSFKNGKLLSGDELFTTLKIQENRPQLDTISQTLASNGIPMYTFHPCCFEKLLAPHKNKLLTLSTLVFSTLDLLSEHHYAAMASINEQK